MIDILTAHSQTHIDDIAKDNKLFGRKQALRMQITEIMFEKVMSN